jgi:hypothetical protein
VRWRAERPLLTVVVLAVVSFALVMNHRWRVGLILFGASLVLAGALRALLTDDRAGLLAVRGRLVDTLVMAVLGGTLIVLAQSLASSA